MTEAWLGGYQMHTIYWNHPAPGWRFGYGGRDGQGQHAPQMRGAVQVRQHPTRMKKRTSRKERKEWRGWILRCESYTPFRSPDSASIYTFLVCCLWTVCHVFARVSAWNVGKIQGRRASMMVKELVALGHWALLNGHYDTCVIEDRMCSAMPLIFVDASLGAYRHHFVRSARYSL